MSRYPLLEAHILYEQDKMLDAVQSSVEAVWLLLEYTVGCVQIPYLGWDHTCDFLIAAFVRQGLQVTTNDQTITVCVP